jgi:subtilase family serine protease
LTRLARHLMLAFPMVLAVAALAPAANAAARGTSAPGAALTDLGRASATTTVDLAIVMRYRNDAQLDRLVELQGNASSPVYRRFLTNAQFDAFFAPQRSEYARTIGLLERAGFRVTQTFANKTLVDVTAPASIAERYFHTEIHRVWQSGVGTRYENVRAGVVPAELARLVASIDGLDNLVHVHPFVRLQPAALTGPIHGPSGGLGPIATAQGYDLPVQHGFDGSGRATGNAICGDFLDSDLKAFLRFFTIARTGPATTRVAVDGGAPYLPPSADPQSCSLESSLDTQTIVGNAPGTTFYEYLIPDLGNKHIDDLYNRVVSDNTVDVLNSSFGGCETQSGNLPKSSDLIAKQGAAKGITFSASSGDSGSFICGSGNGASAPASGPHFVAVGGTILRVDGQGNYKSETGWSGSTGGYSVIFAEPAYQKIISGPLPNGRNTPDIAFASVNVAIRDGGGWGAASGTSWSSPIFCALMTEIDERNAARAGNVQTQIYTAAKNHPTDFHDVTSGSNGLYHAGPGYDLVTGIGSADGYALSGDIK